MKLKIVGEQMKAFAAKKERPAPTLLGKARPHVHHPNGAAQLAMLLEGIDWRAPRRTWRPLAVGVTSSGEQVSQIEPQPFQWGIPPNPVEPEFVQGISRTRTSPGR